MLQRPDQELMPRAARTDAVAAGAGDISPAFGLEEIGIVEMTRGTVFGASMDVWLELLRRVSLLLRTMMSDPVIGNTCPPNMAR
jgi:hypothetical protein